MVTSQNTASMDDTRSHTAWMNLNCYKSEWSIHAWYKITYDLNEFKWLQVTIEHQCMTWDHIPTEWFQMGTSQNTASMYYTRSHTAWMNLNCYKSEWSIHAWYKTTYVLVISNGYKSEYSINAWDNITYPLSDCKWLQVTIQHQCRR